MKYASKVLKMLAPGQVVLVLLLPKYTILFVHIHEITLLNPSINSWNCLLKGLYSTSLTGRYMSSFGPSPSRLTTPIILGRKYGGVFKGALFIPDNEWCEILYRIVDPYENAMPLIPIHSYGLCFISIC